jgi:hypothetical protein
MLIALQVTFVSHLSHYRKKKRERNAVKKFTKLLEKRCFMMQSGKVIKFSIKGKKGGEKICIKRHSWIRFTAIFICFWFLN